VILEFIFRGSNRSIPNSRHPSSRPAVDVRSDTPPDFPSAGGPSSNSPGSEVLPPHKLPRSRSIDRRGHDLEQLKAKMCRGPWMIAAALQCKAKHDSECFVLNPHGGMKLTEVRDMYDRPWHTPQLDVGDPVGLALSTTFPLCRFLEYATLNCLEYPQAESKYTYSLRNE
jgi:hypothetical protein